MLTKFKGNLMVLANRFLKDFGAILAPEMVPGRGIKLPRNAPGAFKSSINGLKIS